MSDPINDIRVVEAARGAGWWAQGWRNFTSSIGTWMGIMLVYIIITILISVVPFVGDVGHSLLAPVFIGGLMLGCRALDRDQPLKVAHLFEGFQAANFVPLLIIGAVDIALTLLLAAVVAAGMSGGGSIMEIMRHGGSDPMEMMSRSAGAIGVSGLFASLAALVIGAVMAALNWFAPALVVLHGAKPIDAMKASFVATWRNWVAFLLYGLIAIALALVVILIVGALAVGFGISIFAGSSIVGMIGIVILGLLLFAAFALVVGPIAFGSTYAGYADVFAEPDAGDTGNPAYR
jgi:hypothetical protein